MAFLLLFIGLLPIIFLPDVFGDGDGSGGNGTGDDDPDVLNPDDNDDNPGDFLTDVDEDTVIDPDEDDDDPDDFDHPVDDGDVLDPDEDDDEPPAASSGVDDGSLLQQYLAEQPDTATDEYESADEILFEASEDGFSDEEVATDPAEVDALIDEEEDLLDSGDDQLIFDKADTAGGDEGSETFWLYHDSDAGAEHVEITDFSPGEDFLHISLNPDVNSGLPEVSVTPSEDGLDGIVTIDGNVVVILQGAPATTAADIHVDMPENTFG